MTPVLEGFASLFLHFLPVLFTECFFLGQLLCREKPYTNTLALLPPRVLGHRSFRSRQIGLKSQESTHENAVGNSDNVLEFWEVSAEPWGCKEGGEFVSRTGAP